LNELGIEGSTTGKNIVGVLGPRVIGAVPSVCKR
jgi:hypothetical protein